MATVESLSRRHLDIVKLYEDNLELVKSIQQQAILDLVPLLISELNLDQDGIDKVNSFLNDRVTVFRFCRRAKFSISHSLTLLHSTLTYRLTTSLSSPHPILTLESPLYLSLPLFYFHPSLVDKFGRPCAVLNLSLVARSPDGGLEGLKEFTRVGWEMGRRWLSDLSNKDVKGKGKATEDGSSLSDDESGVKVQMVMIVDLLGAGMSNLEFELLPFFMDLLKNHFPGMVGAIFVLNYGWMYAGMWQIARRVLPNTALERILFPSKEELLNFFDEEHLLIEHGGTLSYTYTSSNPILEKYGGQTSSILLPSTAAYPSPSPSPIPSRTHSTDSLDDVYMQAASGRSSSSNLSSMNGSAAGPGTMSRRPSGLSMTTLKSAKLEMSSTTGSGSSAGWKSPGESSGGSLLKRVTSFAELQERLMETQKAIESDSGSEEELEEDEDSTILVNNFNGRGKDLIEERESIAREYARQVGETLEGGTSGTEDEGEEENSIDADDEEENEGDLSTDTTPRSSRFSSRVGSRDISTTNSRETSPSGTINSSRKKEGETFSTRAVRFSSQMSPYNTSNPYYGYPAFISPNSLDSSGNLKPHFQRRRKRDLARTLTYLAVLRFLALNRHLKWRISKIVNTVLSLGLIWRKDSNNDLKKKSKVRWDEGVKQQERKPVERVKVDIRIVYALVALLVIRSSLGSRILINSTKRILPTKVFEGANSILIKVITTTSSASNNLSGGLRKRDYLKGLVGMNVGKS